MHKKSEEGKGAMRSSLVLKNIFHATVTSHRFSTLASMLAAGGDCDGDEDCDAHVNGVRFAKGTFHS